MLRRPPPAALLAYRFLGWRLGPDHREWVHDDLTRPGWVVRQGAPAVSALLLVGAVLTGLLDGDPGRLMTIVVLLVVGGLVVRRSLRDRAERQQGLDGDGHPLPEASWYADPAARRRRNAMSAVATVVLVVAGLALIAGRSSS